MNEFFTNWESLEAAVLEVGLLPYFKNKIKGYSVEERVPENLLWDINSGPWDWKGSITRNGLVAYGKFFGNRAGYVAVDVFPDFMNLRRFYSNFKEGSEEYRVYKLIVEHESLLSRELKALAGYTQDRRARRSPNPFDRMPDIDANGNSARRLTDSRFDTIMTHLQMWGYVVIADFEYQFNRHGEPYGWGIARYTTPEALYGINAEGCNIEESFLFLFNNLRQHLDNVPFQQLSRLIYGR